jgi:hypothetical protein
MTMCTGPSPLDGLLHGLVLGRVHQIALIVIRRASEVIVNVPWVALSP